MTSQPRSLSVLANTKACLLYPHPLLSLLNDQHDRRTACLLRFLRDSAAACVCIHGARRNWCAADSCSLEHVCSEHSIRLASIAAIPNLRASKMSAPQSTKQAQNLKCHL